MRGRDVRRAASGGSRTLSFPLCAAPCQLPTQEWSSRLRSKTPGHHMRPKRIQGRSPQHVSVGRPGARHPTPRWPASHPPGGVKGKGDVAGSSRCWLRRHSSDVVRRDQRESHGTSDHCRSKQGRLIELAVPSQPRLPFDRWAMARLRRGRAAPATADCA